MTYIEKYGVCMALIPNFSLMIQLLNVKQIEKSCANEQKKLLSEQYQVLLEIYYYNSCKVRKR